MKTSISRRLFVQGSGALLGAILTPGLWARTQSFDATEMHSALELLTEGQPISDHPDIELNVPDLAEDSSKVPIQVYAPLEGIQKISVFVESNPAPLISISHISAQTEPYVSLRVKMRSSSNVIALAHTSSGIFRASRMVTVTAGGCA